MVVAVVVVVVVFSACPDCGAGCPSRRTPVLAFSPLRSAPPRSPTPGALLQRGAYAYRSFAFTTGGRLSSTAGDAAAQHLPPPLAAYDPEVVIDRVVVLGLPGGPQGWTATLVAGGAAEQQQQQQDLEAAPGPLYNREGLADVALVVRKAGLPVRGDWSVQFSRSAGAGDSVS